MEDVQFDRQNWTSWLKEELALVIKYETAKLLPFFNKQYSNFRAVNGLPICFYCKRLGHVKKYCRKRNSDVETPSKGNEKLLTNCKASSELTNGTSTEHTKGGIDKEKVTQEESQLTSGNAVDILSKVEKLFRDLQFIASELHEAIASAYRNQCSPSESIGDFETSLLNEEMQPVVQRVANIVNIISCPPRNVGTRVDNAVTTAPAPASNFATPESVAQNCVISPWTNLSNFGIT